MKDGKQVFKPKIYSFYDLRSERNKINFTSTVLANYNR